jgi:hypothetical protein
MAQPPGAVRTEQAEKSYYLENVSLDQLVIAGKQGSLASDKKFELKALSTFRLKLQRDIIDMVSMWKAVGKGFSTRRMLVERNERESTIARAAWMLSEDVPREQFK